MTKVCGVGGLSLWTLMLTSSALAAKPDAATDWPQWRGPNRNGIAPAGPKLLDAWPKEGPKLLWKSEPIPSATEGGCGSVTVAGGKAFVFVHWKHKGVSNIVITTKLLNDFGWVEDMPVDLAKKVDEARAKRGNIPDEKLDAYAKAFLATLDPETVAKYGPFIETRIHDRSFDTMVAGGKALDVLAAFRDKEFASWDELLKTLEKQGINLIFPGDDKYNAFRDELIGKGYHYTDSIICLDAQTGQEIWKKDFPGVIPSAAMMMYIGASSTPAVWQDKCYVTGSAGLYCLSVTDGSVLWQTTTKFSNSSPLVDKGVVYCCVPQLTAFDAKTGHVLWTSDAGFQSVFSSVVLWNAGGTDYLVGGNATRREYFLFCVEAATGKKVWTTRPSKGIYSSPVIAGDMLVSNESDPGARVYKINLEGATMLWSSDVPDHRGASLLVDDGYVYSTSGRYFSTPLRCFDLFTGEEKWVGLGDHGGNAKGASPILADGKIMAQIKDPDAVAERGGSWTVMFRAAPEKFEELGQFHSEGATCTSPSVADGKLYLRQQYAVACWDIAEHRPYMHRAKVTNDALVFDLGQVEGGLAASGPIEGLSVTDAAGKTQVAKARVDGDSLVVDLKQAAVPLKVSYAAGGNLAAKNGPLAPFAWSSPRLTFDRSEANTLVLKFEPFQRAEVWRSAKTYDVAGAKITGVELDRSGETLRLATDKTWKPGDKAMVRYSAFPDGSPSGRMAESSFTVTPGRPVTEVPLVEFLFGELREHIDTKTFFQHDDLDKNIKPVAGEKWKAFKGTVEALEGNRCIDLNKQYRNLNLENTLVHACVYVHSETNCKVQLWVYADDGLQILVNGKDVYTSPEPFQKTKIPDVELQKGWNTLLLGITQTAGFWGFSLSVRNEQGDGPPLGLRYTSELPIEK